MQIQPITTWQNGEAKQANDISLVIINDNCATTAVINYYLNNVNEVVDADNIITTVSNNLIIGTLGIEGEDYQTWDADASANAWIYNWAAGQLNLVLIPETV